MTRGRAPLHTALELTQRASGAVATTFVNAGGSLVLQVLAARTLGAAGYGGFTLATTVLTLVVALQTGWVGDTLTVLDRRDRNVRGALIISHLGFVVLGAAAAAVLMLAFGLGGGYGAAMFAVLIPLWLTEEVGRRILMARQEFWQLVLNDSVYVGVTLLSLAGWTAAGHRISVSAFLGVMSVGAAAAILLVLRQLPREEFAPGALSLAGARTVLDFAVWRSAQAGIRPLGLFITRVLIATLASRAILGEVEAARLMLAPVITFLNGISSFLLPYYTRRQRRTGRIDARALTGVIAGLVAFVAVVGLLAAVFVRPLTGLLTSGQFPIGQGVVLGWTAFTVAFAAGMPSATALVAQRRSQLVFKLRMVDLLIGIGLVVLVMALHLPRAAPAAVAGGAVVGAALLYAQALRNGDTTASPVTPEPAVQVAVTGQLISPEGDRSEPVAQVPANQVPAAPERGVQEPEGVQPAAVADASDTDGTGARPPCSRPGPHRRPRQDPQGPPPRGK